MSSNIYNCVIIMIFNMATSDKKRKEKGEVISVTENCRVSGQRNMS